MKKSGALIIGNYQGKVSLTCLGDATAIADALTWAGKRYPQIATAISTAAVELDSYSEALKTGEALRKIIEDDSKSKK